MLGKLLGHVLRKLLGHWRRKLLGYFPGADSILININGSDAFMQNLSILKFNGSQFTLGNLFVAISTSGFQ